MRWLALALLLACCGGKREHERASRPEEAPVVEVGHPPPTPAPELREVPCRVADSIGVSALALGDLDGDGLADLVLTSTYYYYRSLSWYIGYSYWYVYGQPYSSTRALKGDGQGGFVPIPNALPDPSLRKGLDLWQGDDIALGDLDGDGDLDLSLKHADPGVGDYYSWSYSSWSSGVRYYYWYRYWTVKYGARPPERALKGDGKGGFTDAPWLTPAGFGDPLRALGDVDGDGTLDLMTYDGGFRLWLRK
jgi:hypothetical protein